MTPNPDLLILGAGIAGAGVALEAARRGQKVLLVEREDFASGASSASSKLVHGGLRYLKQGAFQLTRESLHEREQLLEDAPGLVEPLRFALAHQTPRWREKLPVRIGLALYDHLAGRRTRAHASAAEAATLVPGLHAPGGLSLFEDATTDDARLTLRVLQEAQAHGAEIRNRTDLLQILRDADGQVQGARLRGPDGFERQVSCRCVVLAVGAHSGALAGTVGLQVPPLRPLRGSHLLLPLWRLPLPCAVAWAHPQDGRPVFAYPWQGALLVGTTDVDHPEPERAPVISAAEQAYLLAGLNHAFPRSGIAAADVRSTWAGLRPVPASAPGRAPSSESREHRVEAHRGVVLLCGGKLTTFRVMARAVLATASPWLPGLWPEARGAILMPAQDLPLPLSEPAARRLRGRFGALSAQVLAAGPQPLPGTDTWLGEIRHSLRHEQVRQLDDLLLRRTRLGLLQPRFGAELLPLLRLHCQELLGWSGERFMQESTRYLDLMQARHAPHPDSR